jgi:hypothetical protein
MRPYRRGGTSGKDAESGLCEIISLIISVILLVLYKLYGQ